MGDRVIPYGIAAFASVPKAPIGGHGHCEGAVDTGSCAGTPAGGASAVGDDTPIGRLPAPGSLDVTGLGLSQPQLDLLLTVDAEIWRKEVSLIPPFYEGFGDRLPAALWAQYDALAERLAKLARTPAMADAE